MFEVIRLLKFTPEEAILMVANKEMNTHLRPEIAQVGEVISLGGLRTKVRIHSLDVKPEMIQNPYSGITELEYNRYDLSSIFDVILSDIEVPTTVQSVLDRITESTGILFDEHDFVNERIVDEEYWLTAAPDSRRWVGSVKVIFNASDIGTHISQYLPINDHGGLVNVQKEYIWDAFQNDILNGLERGKPGIGIYLRNNDHDGLVKDARPSMDFYVIRQDHDGLTKESKPFIGVYLPTKDHDGLVYVRLVEYGITNTDDFDVDF